MPMAKVIWRWRVMAPVTGGVAGKGVAARGGRVNVRVARVAVAAGMAGWCWPLTRTKSPWRPSILSIAVTATTSPPGVRWCR